MLTVCSRLAEDHRACNVIYRLTEAVDRLSVGFHISLLKVCRESCKGLCVRKYSSAVISKHVSLIHADQCIQHGGICHRISLSSQLVSFCSSLKDSIKYIRTQSERKDSSSNSRSRRISSADIIIHKESCKIITALSER